MCCHGECKNVILILCQEIYLITAIYFHQISKHKWKNLIPKICDFNNDTIQTTADIKRLKVSVSISGFLWIFVVWIKGKNVETTQKEIYQNCIYPSKIIPYSNTWMDLTTRTKNILSLIEQTRIYQPQGYSIILIMIWGKPTMMDAGKWLWITHGWINISCQLWVLRQYKHNQWTKLGDKQTEILRAPKAPFQYKDHLSQVRGFPCLR